jgi:hypothetical protein
MKKYLVLLAAVLSITIANGQSDKRLDPKFIYDKLTDIFHQSVSMNQEEYFSALGFGYGVFLTENESDGSVTYPHDNYNHDKQFSFTTRSISEHIASTVQSAYATNDRKEYKNLLEYIKGLGYKLTLSKYHDKVQTDIYQLNNLMITFAHYYYDNGPNTPPNLDFRSSSQAQQRAAFTKPTFIYKMIYTINAN